jgi:uncharacterized repeat protein (TIGR03803 family)
MEGKAQVVASVSYVAQVRWALSLVLTFGLLLVSAASAQTFQVLHTFTGPDGASPYSGITVDRAGNLYGTTEKGGDANVGTVFKLSQRNGEWIFNPLYMFRGANDGSEPTANVVVGPDGTLYGTTYQGGAYNGGTVFRLQPPATSCHTVLCPWTKTELYAFPGEPDGAEPEGSLIFDAAGNMYGGTEGSGDQGNGTVYEMVHSSGGWTHTVLSADVQGSPMNGVAMDSEGNLYGTTIIGGIGYGSVYQLAHSGSGWTLHTLSTFEDNGDGVEPTGGLIVDAAGNLYGGTPFQGNYGGGTVFEMSHIGSNWMMFNLYQFTVDNVGVTSTLTMDSTGNLYGTTDREGAYFYGNVFKLTRSNDGWIYTDLYDFTGGTDGGYPWGSVGVDANGNVYGTTSIGGSSQCRAQPSGCGTVWNVTP